MKRKQALFVTGFGALTVLLALTALGRSRVTASPAQDAAAAQGCVDVQLAEVTGNVP